MSDDAKFISELKALVEKATPGPWYHRQETVDRSWIADHPDHGMHTKIIIGKCSCYGGADDYAFIAAAKTAVPRLIQMVEELSRDLANAEKYREETEIERDKIGNRLGDTRRELRASLEEVARLKRLLDWANSTPGGMGPDDTSEGMWR